MERISGELGDKLGDLDDTPWAYLSDAIAALAYRIDRLESRFEELAGDGS